MIAWPFVAIISVSDGFGYPGQSPYSRPSKTRPPFSIPTAPNCPFIDHRLHGLPSIVPLATCFAEPSSAVGGPPDVSASVVGPQIADPSAPTLAPEELEGGLWEMFDPPERYRGVAVPGAPGTVGVT